MSRLNVAATKSNLLSLKHDLSVATEGFSLLDQKREILVMELMRLLDRIRRVQAEFETAQETAYETLKKAIAQNGYQRLRSVASGVNYEHKCTTQTRILAGVRVPVVKVTHGELTSQYGFSDTDSLVDCAMRDFLVLLKVIGRMAELETAVWLFARELKKTQRRVNALEQIFIPDFQDTLAYINDVLEGKDMEAKEIFVCQTCGNTVEDAAPESCPICGMPASCLPPM